MSLYWLLAALFFTYCYEHTLYNVYIFIGNRLSTSTSRMPSASIGLMCVNAHQRITVGVGLSFDAIKLTEGHTRTNKYSLYQP